MKGGWQTKTLGEVAEVIAGQSPEGPFYNNSGVGLPFYQGKKEFGEKFIGPPTTWSSQITKVALEGDVLMSVRAPVGPVNFATQQSCIGRGLAAIRSGKDLDRSYLFYFLLSKQEEICVAEGAVFASIKKDDIQSIKIELPPIPEQRKIAAILSTWDKALEKLDALIAAKEHRRKALMQQLLTGQKRVKGFIDKWRTPELGSVVKPISRPVPKPDEPFLAAGIRSHGKGVFLKQGFNPSEIALDELFQLRTDDLVVNITFAWEGALAIVPPEANGALVSHRFPAFLCEEGKAALGFIRHLIRTKHFVFLCGLSSPGGAGRNRVLSKTSFLKIAVRMPSFPEQTAIANILDTCDEELRIIRGQRAAVDRQKRGLMQRLLTGRVRVRPEKESRLA